MRTKKKQITFWVSDEEQAKIKKNAEAFSLATGTYLRLLGLLGGTPFALTQPQAHLNPPMRELEVHEGTDKAKQHPFGKPTIGYWRNKLDNKGYLLE